MEHKPEPDALTDAFAAVAKGLSNPARLTLLDLVAQGERPVEALAQAAGLQLSTASSHLQGLHRAGLVARRRDGTRVLYRLAGDDVAQLLTTLRSVARRRIAGVALAREALLGDEGSEELPVVDLGARELIRRARKGELVVLDVRPAEEYSGGHIPGAVSIPVDELAGRLGELELDTRVIAYCRGKYCVMSRDAVRLLRAHGYEAAVMANGMLEWRADGHQVVA